MTTNPKGHKMNFQTAGGSDTPWFDIIKADHKILAETAYKYIDQDEKLLNRQESFAEDDPNRNIAPYARRIDRFVSEITWLGVQPWLDIEHGDKSGEDNSLALEAFQEQLGSRMGANDLIAKAHRKCVYSPVSWLKTAMPFSVSWHRGYRDIASVAVDPSRDALDDGANQPEFEEVPEEDIPAFNVEELAQITPDVAAKAKINDMPTLATMSTPRAEVVDPRHVVTDPLIGGIDEAYYIAHLILRTPQQAAMDFGGQPSDYPDRQIIKKVTDEISIAGVKTHSFRPMTNQELCVFAEVYIRQDPKNPEIENMWGLMDFSTGRWIKEPIQMDTPLRWTMIRADQTHPRVWEGPSYISMARDDIEDLAWVRKQVREHVRWSAQDAAWIPKQVKIPAEVLAEIDEGRFTRRYVQYEGPRFDFAKSHTRPIPPALIQMEELANSSFARNTGATGTAQGHGSSNKVATAFNQEQAFMDKRAAAMMVKLYNAYIQVMLIATWLVLNYGASKFVVRKNGVRFTLDRDMVRGIADYSIKAVNRSAQDPLSARLMMVQQLKELFSNPTLLQHFNASEVAKLIAGLNGWPSSVLMTASPEAPPTHPSPGTENPGESGTSARIGDGVDSPGSGAQNSEEAAAGAAQRGT